MALLASACAGEAAKRERLRLAATTSTVDSGILDALVSPFEAEHDVRVDVIAAGTGHALKLGESGDVDVLLVHARAAEDEFMAAGFGARHEPVMRNSFVLLGPAEDDAGVRGDDPLAALRQISRRGARFVSRGDESGTHLRERELWRLAGGLPEWSGYVESGQGQGATLVMADQFRGYVLSDVGTYLRFRDKIDLVPLVSDSSLLDNPYGAIVVSSSHISRDAAALADRFVDYLVSPAAQATIRDFRAGGEPLFFPLHEADPS